MESIASYSKAWSLALPTLHDPIQKLKAISPHGKWLNSQLDKSESWDDLCDGRIQARFGEVGLGHIDKQDWGLVDA